MCSQTFFTIKGPLKPSENVMNIHFHGGTIEQFWVKDASFYLIFLCIFWHFFEFFFAQNLKSSVYYLKNSFPCSKNYLICLNLSLNTPYFTSVFPSQWSLNLMARILLLIVLLCGGIMYFWGILLVLTPKLRYILGHFMVCAQRNFSLLRHWCQLLSSLGSICKQRIW